MADDSERRRRHADRERARRAAFTPGQREAERSRKRIAAMTPERAEAERKADRARRAVQRKARLAARRPCAGMSHGGRVPCALPALPGSAFCGWHGDRPERPA